MLAKNREILKQRTEHEEEKEDEKEGETRKIRKSQRILLFFDFILSLGNEISLH